MVVVLMGVSGSGKTTIGKMLADDLNWQFHEGDDLHPQSNREKMSRGIPLTDSDRLPWLTSIRRLIERCLAGRVSAVIACSALKESYRQMLVVDPAKMKIVYLKGTPELLAQRIANRKGHFMPPALLPSQLDTLEEPRDAITVDISGTPNQIVDAIRRELAV